MQLRKNIQKIGALAGTTAMLLTSIATPVSAQLGDLPSPFIQDGSFNGQIVVGEEAQAEDILGAIDIASSFQARATTPVTVSGSGEVEVTGGEDYESLVGEFFTDDSLDDSDFANFADDEVSVNDKDYDYQELLNLGTNNKVTVSGLESYNEEDNYGQDAYLEIPRGNVSYEIVFDEQVLSEDITEDPMELQFLGRTIEVLDVDTDEIQVKTSNEYTLEQGDSVEVDGNTVELVRVGQSSVLVSVNGQQKAVSYDPVEEVQFEDSDDFEVQVDSAFYEENSENNLAVLDLGSSITETYETNDALEIFGGTDDEDDADYVWQITTASDSGDDDDDSKPELLSIGIINNQDYAEATADDEDDRAGIMQGEELELPNNYASIMFDGFTESAMTQYEDISLSFDSEDFTNREGEAPWAGAPVATSGNMLVLEAEDDHFVLEEEDGTS